MSLAPSPELAAAYAHCRAVAKREAKNFYYAFLVLPKHKSDAMCAVYAFMRRADDLADDESLTMEQRRAAMAEWTAALRASRGESTSDPVFLALNDTQRRFGIPDELLDQLVEGTTFDLQETQPGVQNIRLTSADASRGKERTDDVGVYQSFDHLYRYCYLVASVVGLVCIRIFGYSDPRAEVYAEHTGVAFQLTNILRDVCEDAARGRIYLPLDDMERAGASPQTLWNACDDAPTPDDVRGLLQIEIDRAQEYYRAAESLIPLLDADARPAMRILVEIYHRLLDRIAAEPEAVFHQRVSVPTATKLAILGRGLLASAFARRK